MPPVCGLVWGLVGGFASYGFFRGLGVTWARRSFLVCTRPLGRAKTVDRLSVALVLVLREALVWTRPRPVWWDPFWGSSSLMPSESEEDAELLSKTWDSRSEWLGFMRGGFLRVPNRGLTLRFRFPTGANPPLP